MYSGKETGNILLQVMFLALIITLGVVIFFELDYFISSILGAITLYVLLRTPHQKLMDRGWSRGWSTFFLLVLTVLVFFVAGGGLFGAVFSKVKHFNMQTLVDNANNLHDLTLEKLGFNLFSKEMIDKAVDSVGEYLPKVLSSAGGVVSNGIMMIFILYFMLQGGHKMEEKMESNIPLSRCSVSMIREETISMVMSNAIGVPVIMIGQGLVAGLGYWMTGAGDPVIWGMFTGIASVIPVVGTAIVWVPMAVNLLISGETANGIILIAYALLVISLSDNVIRMVFLKRLADVHPLITIFGIIAGINLLGFWGIIFGPLMISGVMLMARIYRIEFLHTPAPERQAVRTRPKEPDKPKAKVEISE